MSKRVRRAHAPEQQTTQQATPPVRGVLGRAAAAIHGFFELEIDPFILGVFRAALGAFLLLFYLMQAPSWTFYYGFPGLAPLDRTATASHDWLSPLFFHMRSNTGMWVLYGVSLASAVLLALGVWWRVACFWLWQMNVGLMVGSPFTINGEEQVMSLLLLFGLFMPLGSALTLRELRDRERRRAMLCGDGGPRVKVWALRALQVHLMFVYLISLPDKMTDESWRNGTLVYYAMMAWDYPRWPGIEIFAWGNAALSRVLTLFALIVEVLVPVLIWLRRWRVPCVLAAMSLHVGMGLLIEGVMMFNATMLVAMLVFLPSGRTRRFVARVLRLRPPSSSAPTPSPVP